jgi:hypothetical protein
MVGFFAALSTVLYNRCCETDNKAGKLFFQFVGFCSVFVRVFAFTLPIELVATEWPGDRTFTIGQRQSYENGK